MNTEKLISEIKNKIKNSDVCTDRHFISVKYWENHGKKRVYVKFNLQQKIGKVKAEGYVDLDNDNVFVDQTEDFYKGSEEHKVITNLI